MKGFNKIRRQLNRYSHEQLITIADSASVSISTLCAWRDWRVESPRLSTLSRVAPVLGFDINIGTK